MGGTIVLFMGIRLLFRKGEEAEVPEVSGKVRMFLSSFAVGITNPAAILTFLFAFSWFGIAGDNTKAGGQLPEDEPDFRSSIELVWNPCFYKGNPDMKLCEKVKKGAGIR